MPEYPKSPLYLFYGNQIPEILRARDAVVAQFLNDETRAESLKEYGPPSNRYGPELAKLVSEMNSESAAMSLIADAAKVFIVTNPLEIYGGDGAPRAAKKPPKKKAKDGEKSPEERMLAWFEKTLPDTGNRVVLLAFEDEGAGREVNESHPLVQLVGRIGYQRRFRDEKAFFRIEDALRARNAAAFLSAVEDLWDPQHGGTMKIYNAVTRSIRFMLQAGIGRERKAESDPAKMALYFPQNRSLSVYKQHPVVTKKYVSSGAPYRTADLWKAYEELLDFYRALRPRATDLYVPDQRLLLERIILSLIASPAPPRRY